MGLGLDGQSSVKFKLTDYPKRTERPYRVRVWGSCPSSSDDFQVQEIVSVEYSQFGYSPIPGAERLDSEVEQLTHEAQRTLYRDGGGLSTLQNQTEGSCGCSRGSLAGKLPGSPVHSVRQALQVCLLRENHCWAISRLVHQLDRHNPLIHRHPWLFPNRFGKLKVQSRRNSRETGGLSECGPSYLRPKTR
jgi:hypothetical protein